MSYYINTIISMEYDKAIDYVKEALKTEGFGVISEIDIQDKLKDKLDVDFKKYKILGACNPAYAYQALQKEDKIGTMLPCNVIIQEQGKNKIEVAAVDPIASMQAVENTELGSLALDIQGKLKKVIMSL